MGYNFTAKTGDFYMEFCCRCGVHFAIPDAIHRTALKERGRHPGFYCVNGHVNVYLGEPEADILRRERDRLKQDTARLADEARAAADRADKAEGALKRHKKRAAAGTCPCCKRTFHALAEHMRKQHPSFVAGSVSNVVPLAKAAGK